MKPIGLYHDQYTLEGKLGGGGFATVYLAGERGQEEPRAIKISRVVADDPGIASTIHVEARLLSNLDHKSLVKVLPISRGNAHPIYSANAVELSGSPAFFVMEYLPGGVLKDLLAISGPLPPPEAAAIALDVARGLFHMHQAGYAHNDLKLENIVMRQPVRAGEPYTPVLIDLGVATKTKKPDGQSLYVNPPERIRESKLETAPELMEPIDGTKVDVWGLGVVLYRMLGGRLPFSGNERSMTQRILSERPTALTRLSTLISPEMEALVIDGCLAKTPADRLSMLELGRELANFGHGAVAERDIDISRPGRSGRGLRFGFLRRTER